MTDLNQIVKKIEGEKEDRAKCIFYFTLTLNTKERRIFRKQLKKLINNITKSSNQEQET